VKDIGGKHGAAELKQGLDTLPGVMSVSVDDKFQEFAVDYDTSGVKQSQLKSKIEDMGYDITRAQYEEQFM